MKQQLATIHLQQINNYSNVYKQTRKLTSIDKRNTIILCLRRTRKDHNKQAVQHPVFETYEVIHIAEIRLQTVSQLQKHTILNHHILDTKYTKSKEKHRTKVFSSNRRKSGIKPPHRPIYAIQILTILFTNRKIPAIMSETTITQQQEWTLLIRQE